MFNITSWRHAVRAACIVALTAAGCWTPAQAATNVLPAGTCEPLNNGSGKYRVHLTQYGIVNNAEETVFVLCPIVRQHSAGNVAVTVMGSVDAGASMSCSLYSNIAESSLILAKSFVVNGPATGSLPFGRSLYIEGKDAPLGAFLTVACGVPANHKGRLRGLLVSG